MQWGILCSLNVDLLITVICMGSLCFISFFFLSLSLRFSLTFSWWFVGCLDCPFSFPHHLASFFPNNQAELSQQSSSVRTTVEISKVCKHTSRKIKFRSMEIVGELSHLIIKSHYSKNKNNHYSCLQVDDRHKSFLTSMSLSYMSDAGKKEIKQWALLYSAINSSSNRSIINKFSSFRVKLGKT